MKIDWSLFAIGLSWMAVGGWMLMLVLRPQTTWQEVMWVVRWAWLIGVPIFLVTLGGVGVWASFSRKG